MQAKEFLGNSDIEFLSYNIFEDPEGQRVHRELGSPVVPCLVVDGKNYPILHATQIASLLGIPMPDHAKNTLRTSYDIVTIMESWIKMLDMIDYELMTMGTKSRNRSVALMTVNAFHPISLLPGGWEHGNFEWHTRESDQRRVDRLTDADKVRSFAADCLLTYQVFLNNYEEELEARDPMVTTSNKGEVPFSVLVQSQRSHMAIHHRQMVDFLKDHGRPTDDLLDVETIPDLQLPAALY